MPPITRNEQLPVDYFLGIDPGKSGAATLLDKHVKPVLIDGKISCVFGKLSEQEIACWFDTVHQLQAQGCSIKAAIERVHAMPKQGVTSSFTFGQSYGFLRGMLAAYDISYVTPTPQQWQKALNCLTSGNKNVSKNRAHQLWPKLSKQLTHANSDSALIAYWLIRDSFRI